MNRQELITEFAYFVKQNNLNAGDLFTVIELAGRELSARQVISKEQSQELIEWIYTERDGK